jgi:hypothetical protein
MNRSRRRQYGPNFYDTIPRLQALAERIGIDFRVEEERSWDDRVRRNLMPVDRLHVDIVGNDAADHFLGGARGCSGQAAYLFHAAFDIIGEVLDAWPELKDDLATNVSRQGANAVPELAQIVGSVFRELGKIGNPVFHAALDRPQPPLPDEVLENIGNILIAASLPAEG